MLLLAKKVVSVCLYMSVTYVSLTVFSKNRCYNDFWKTQLVKHMFNVSSIPVNYTLQTTSVFTDAVIIEAL